MEGHQLCFVKNGQKSKDEKAIEFLLEHGAENY